MNEERIAQNLAAVVNHFHSEALNDVEAALSNIHRRCHLGGTCTERS